MRLTFTLMLDADDDVVWSGAGHWPMGEALEEAGGWWADDCPLREFWVTITGSLDDPQTEIVEL